MPKTTACPDCGSTSPRAFDEGTGRCKQEKGCHVRRCHRRQLLDARRGVREQCHAVKTSKHGTTLWPCELCVGHEGKHLNGAKEWESDAPSEFMEAFRGA